MIRSKIIIEEDGKVTPHEADQFILVSIADGVINVTSHGGTETILGLVEIAQWHIKKDWEAQNKMNTLANS